MADLALGFPVSFEEAIAWAKARGVVLPEVFYKELTQEARALAFTVSGLSQISQIQRVLDTLVTALEEGQTFAQWQRAALDDPALTQFPQTLLETIFRTNLQSTYQSGRWEQFEQSKEDRPYLLFDAILDARTTQVCRHLDGIIRPVDDPIWKKYAPPNHFNCRSTLISLNADQARARSSKESGLNQEEPTQPAAKGFGGQPRASRLQAIQQNIKDLGAQCTAAAEGFAKKPKAKPIWCGDQGQDYLDLLATALDANGPLPEPRKATALKLLPTGQNQQAALRAFMAEFGADATETVLYDSLRGIHLAIDEDLFLKQSGASKITKRGREEYLLYVARGIQEPDEVWLKREGAKAFLYYLARFSVRKESVPILAVFEWDGDAWVGVTGYRVERESYFLVQFHATFFATTC